MSKANNGKGDNDYCIDIDIEVPKINTCELCGNEVNELGFCSRCGYIDKTWDDE